MKKTELTLPELALIGGTRGLLGAGVALLLPVSSKRIRERPSVGHYLLLEPLVQFRSP
jgi:hypothetical protein